MIHDRHVSKCHTCFKNYFTYYKWTRKLTPSSRFILQKLTVPNLVNKCSASKVHFFTTLIKNTMQSCWKPDESNPRHTLPLNTIIPSRGGQVFQNSRSHLKIFGAKTETGKKLHTEDPQILGATVQNIILWATWCQRYVQHCFHLLLGFAGCTLVSRFPTLMYEFFISTQSSICTGVKLTGRPT